VVDCAHPRTMSAVDSDCTSRYYYGVMLSFKAQGRFGFIDVLRLSITVGAMMSYLVVPMWIVYFLALYGLGPLSSFYSSKLNEKFQLDDALVQFVCGAMVSTISFRELVGDQACLSKEHLLHEVHRAFGTRGDFGLEEQARLAELVWDRMAAKARASQATMPDARGSSPAAWGEEPSIRAPTFAQSIVSGQVRNSLGPLLIARRRMMPVEFAFTPRRQFRAPARVPRTVGVSMDVDELQGPLPRPHLEVASSFKPQPPPGELVVTPEVLGGSPQNFGWSEDTSISGGRLPRAASEEGDEGARRGWRPPPPGGGAEARRSVAAGSLSSGARSFAGEHQVSTAWPNPCF